MFEFIHEIMEAWILESASSGLGEFRRSLLKSHLNGCARCRAFALDLVEFSHGLEPKTEGPKFSAADQSEMHTRIMAAFHRERRAELEAAPFKRAAGPLLRLSFVKALGMVLLIVAVAMTLSYPLRHADSDEAAGQANLAAVAIALQPSPTPTPPAKAEPKIYPTAPALKTENR